MYFFIELSVIVDKRQTLSSRRTRRKDAVEKDIRLVDGNAATDLTLYKEKWRGLLVTE